MKRAGVVLGGLALGLWALGGARAPAVADEGLAPLVGVLAEIDDDAVRSDLLAGIRDGLKGRKSVPQPAGWDAVYAKLKRSNSAEVRGHARALAIVFGDAAAIEEMRATVLSSQNPPAERNAALTVLIDKRVADLAPTLQKLLDDDAVRRTALRGLAAYPDPASPGLILERYARWSDDEKQDALATLTARRESALALLDALDAQRVPRGDLLPVLVRQLHALGDEKLSQRVREVWGDLRETPRDKLVKIEHYTRQLTPARLAEANLRNGQAIYRKTCQQCHMLYGEGRKIGPDLTGSNRANLEYILTNVIDPSAVIAKEYKMHVVITVDGRVLTGMIIERSGDRLTLQTVNEQVTLVMADIEELSESAVSMMPEGQFDALTPDEVRDLVAYLATKGPLEEAAP